MQIFLKYCGDYKTCVLEVDPTDTVLKLKYIIQSKIGIFHGNQKICYAGKILDCSNDNDPIDKYGITKESTIRLYERDQYYYVGNDIKETNFGSFEKINNDHEFRIVFNNYHCDINEDDISELVGICIYKNDLTTQYPASYILYTTDLYFCIKCEVKYYADSKTLIVKPYKSLPYGSKCVFLLDKNIIKPSKKIGYRCDFFVEEEQIINNIDLNGFLIIDI